MRSAEGRAGLKSRRYKKCRDMRDWLSLDGWQQAADAKQGRRPSRLRVNRAAPLHQAAASAPYRKRARLRAYKAGGYGRARPFEAQGKHAVSLREFGALAGSCSAIFEFLQRDQAPGRVVLRFN